MTFYWSRRLTSWQAAWLFGGAGFVLLLVPAYMAWQLGIELRTWPRIDAYVDSADVTTQPNTTQTSYVARLWVAYRFNGHDYRVQTTTRALGLWFGAFGFAFLMMK